MSDKPANKLERAVEKQIDSQDQDVEAHIEPLMESIRNLKIEKIDLTSKEGAQSALPMLDEVLNKLGLYQRAVHSIRSTIKSNRQR